MRTARLQPGAQASSHAGAGADTLQDSRTLQCSGTGARKSAGYQPEALACRQRLAAQCGAGTKRDCCPVRKACKPGMTGKTCLAGSSACTAKASLQQREALAYRIGHKAVMRTSPLVRG